MARAIHNNKSASYVLYFSHRDYMDQSDFGSMNLIGHVALLADPL